MWLVLSSVVIILLFLLCLIMCFPQQQVIENNASHILILYLPLVTEGPFSSVFFIVLEGCQFLESWGGGGI